MKTSIVIPCLNENETIERLVHGALNVLEQEGIDGEVVVVDNNSTDNSAYLAKKAGARVIFEKNRGYGNAVIAGVKAAYGTIIFMLDADLSYDVADLPRFLDKFKEEQLDMLIGSRFSKGSRIDEKAMPFHHKYIGNPILSLFPRLLFNIKITDFHCGMRMFDRNKFLDLNINQSGMEFASEMVIKFSLNGRVGELPIHLRRDGRIKNESHLRSVRDGVRHLMCIYRLWKKNKK